MHGSGRHAPRRHASGTLPRPAGLCRSLLWILGLDGALDRAVACEGRRRAGRDRAHRERPGAPGASFGHRRWYALRMVGVCERTEAVVHGEQHVERQADRDDLGFASVAEFDAPGFRRARSDGGLTPTLTLTRHASRADMRVDERRPGPGHRV